MTFTRRHFILTSAGAVAGSVAAYSQPKQTAQNFFNPLDEMQPMADKAVPITLDERKTRIEKAQKLMAENKIGAIYLDGGTSMKYFTGVEWGNSERLMAAIIPARGEVSYVVPHFEEARLRELITIGKDVRVWEEHESPYRVVAGILADAGIKSGKIGMEERVRFFLFDGVRKEASH